MIFFQNEMEMQKRFFETNSNCRKAKVPLSEFDLYVSTTIQPDNDISEILKRYSGQSADDGDEDDYDYEDGMRMQHFRMASREKY